MITIRKEIQSEAVFMLMEEMVPKDSIFRKINKYIDFTFIYDEVKELYSEDNGRPSIDPVVLFKIVFIQAIDGIKSMRKTCKKIEVDAEYRWFLGIPFGKETPHFSTFSKNYERRFKGTQVFENIFIKIIKMASEYGMLNEEFFMDSTHRKANANKNKYEDKIVEEVKKRKEFIEEEINEKARERRLSAEGKELFKKRRTTVERSFGDSKQNHGYRYTLYKGVEKNQAYTHLICAAQNMKNIALKQEKVNGKPLKKAHFNKNTIKVLKKSLNSIKNQKLSSKENLTFFQMWGLSTI